MMSLSFFIFSAVGKTLVTIELILKARMVISSFGINDD